MLRPAPEVNQTGCPAAGADPIEQDRAARLRDGAACRDAALAYLARGWAALALCSPGHIGIDRVARRHRAECTHEGKRPWVRWADYMKKLPTEAKIIHWWRDYPLGNVGVAFGPHSGILGVDVDGLAGLYRLETLSRGEVPRTLAFDTGSPDSFRLLFGWPAGIELRSTPEPGGMKLGPGEELRLMGQRSQTVMPPSRHPSGRYYRWRPGQGPGEIELAPAPAWLIGLMRADRPAQGGVRGGAAPPGGRPPGALDDDEVIPEHHRHTRLTQLAGHLRWLGLVAGEIEATLLAVNAHRCVPSLEEREVVRIARDIGAKPRPANSPLLTGGVSRDAAAGAREPVLSFTLGGR
jgi:hypothetical protein